MTTECGNCKKLQVLYETANHGLTKFKEDWYAATTSYTKAILEAEARTNYWRKKYEEIVDSSYGKE